jgi:hypothetical protein
MRVTRASPLPRTSLSDRLIEVSGPAGLEKKE